jgi:hypothetical protein
MKEMKEIYEHPGEIPYPQKEPEIVPAREPLPNFPPEKTPEIMPGKEPLTQPAHEPMPIPLPPTNYLATWVPG